MQDQGTSGTPGDSASDLDKSGAPVSQPPALITSNFDAMEYFKTYIETVKSVVLAPQVFFANMPTSGGLIEPLTFYCTGLFINAFMVGLLSFNPLAFFMGLILGLVASFAAAGLAYGLSKAMGGKPPSFEAVYRVYAYAGAIMLVAWIPFLGGLAILYGWGLQFFGLKDVAKMNTGQTIAVCVVSGILSAVVCMIAAVVIMIKNMLHI